MKKKNILIAILCVTILLLVPLTPISGAVEPKLSAGNIEKEEDCDCQEISEIGLNRLDKVIEIKDLSNRISILTEMDGQKGDVCFYSAVRFFICAYWVLVYYDAMQTFDESGNILLYEFCKILFERATGRLNYFLDMGLYYDCEWAIHWPPG